MELCTYGKAVFFLPVNILTVWSPALLATRHTVCLDIRSIYSILIMNIMRIVCVCITCM